MGETVTMYWETPLWGIVLDNPKIKIRSNVQIIVRIKRRNSEITRFRSCSDDLFLHNKKSSVEAKARGKMLYGYLTIPDRKKSNVEAT